MAMDERSSADILRALTPQKMHPGDCTAENNFAAVTQKKSTLVKKIAGLGGRYCAFLRVRHGYIKYPEQLFG